LRDRYGNAKGNRAAGKANGLLVCREDTGLQREFRAAYVLTLAFFRIGVLALGILAIESDRDPVGVVRQYLLEHGVGDRGGYDLPREDKAQPLKEALGGATRLSNLPLFAPLAL